MSVSGTLPTCSGCADGSALVRWLESRGARFDRLSASQRRTVQRWRRGQQARFDTVDQLLLDLDVDLRDLPPSIWRHYDNGRRGWRRRAHA